MSKCKWLFDYHMLKDAYHKDLVELCKELNIEYEVLTYIPNYKALQITPFQENPTFEKGECVVAYGSIEFLEALDSLNMGYIPSRYMEINALKCSHYLPNIPSEYLLNDNFIMLPYKEFKKNPNRIYDLYETNKLFVRPDSGLKTFAGTTIHIEDFDYEINSLENLTSVLPTTMILVSPIKKIEKEYRILVGNRKVIAASQYKVKDTVVMKEGAPVEAIKLAEKIICLSEQPDIVYTVDIAQTITGEYKVIELNSFSAAGLYHCNPEIVLKKVSKIAELEYNGDISLGE